MKIQITYDKTFGDDWVQLDYNDTKHFKLRNYERIFCIFKKRGETCYCFDFMSIQIYLVDFLGSEIITGTTRNKVRNEIGEII